MLTSRYHHSNQLTNTDIICQTTYVYVRCIFLLELWNQWSFCQFLIIPKNRVRINFRICSLVHLDRVFHNLQIPNNCKLLLTLKREEFLWYEKISNSFVDFNHIWCMWCTRNPVRIYGKKIPSWGIPIIISEIIPRKRRSFSSSY